MAKRWRELVIYPDQMRDPYERLRASYQIKKENIRRRLCEFQEFFSRASDFEIFEELVFCILTSNAGARMGMRAVERLRDILLSGSHEEIYGRLKNAYRYPGHASYIVTTREFLKDYCGLRLKELVLSFRDSMERRDFFALSKEIKGIGYKQASHFLRNIGFGGYAILDKHVVASLYEYGVVDSPKPPSTRRRYLEVEGKLRDFAEKVGVGFDEMDLLLWSERTGEILK